MTKKIAAIAALVVALGVTMVSLVVREPRTHAIAPVAAEPARSPR
ncbi:MAG: hypothetical protein U1E76_25740 [Planctomycetota bacterium]